MKKKFLYPTIIEVVGIIIVAIGIGIEVSKEAELGFILITGGSVLIAAGALIYSKLIYSK